jgi:hypothetical protein
MKPSGVPKVHKAVRPHCEGEGAMTEERARYYAKKLAFNLGVTFYVVRSLENQIYAVQAPSDDCQILAIVPPAASVHDQWAA